VNDDSRKTSLQVKWENYMMANRNKEFQKTVSYNLVVLMEKWFYVLAPKMLRLSLTKIFLRLT
jgi:hypothetical protein